MLRQMTLLSLFIITFGLASPVVADDTPDLQKCQNRAPEWYQCATDEDCTISTDPCGWPILGVNKLHKDRSEICTRQVGAFIDCPIWKNTPENKMTVSCQQGVCTATKASGQSVQSPAFGEEPEGMTGQ